MELEGQREALRARGLGVAAVSYDSPGVLRDFAARRRITFPLLADPGSVVIRRFGLINPEHPAGDLAHGVPYPGTFVTDASGVVRARFFEDAYAERRTAASFLTLAGDVPAAILDQVDTKAFALRTSWSNPVAAPGQKITLVLDFEMKEGLHAYAPGASSYRALALRLAPEPLVTAHLPTFPPWRPFYFAPLEETVPVFEGRFRVTQDVTLAGGRALAEALKADPPRIVLTGTLEYQACSARVCYPPASLALRFPIGLIPLDRERSPEALRRSP